MALYTQEQIEQANNINLEEYLIRRGEKLKRRKAGFTTGTPAASMTAYPSAATAGMTIRTRRAATR